MDTRFPGQAMFDLAERLWPINRSLTGRGVKLTLEIIKEELPELQIKTVETGMQVFDWRVPDEWNVSEAYILTPDGKRICDFSENNLHLMGYSTPVNKEVSLSELQHHLYSLPNQPDAIPYVTSYYEKKWGFCLSENLRNSLPEGNYKVVIDASISAGHMHFGEAVLPGESTQEVMFSTYICHPSMANNELSGPVLSTALAAFIRESYRHFTYRFVFVPETIGSLTYISQNLAALKQNLLAGFILTCVGDDRTYSYLPSRKGNTVADNVALSTLKTLGLSYKSFDWKDRGSDERQYCSPGVDLPVCSIMRSKYGEFPEYHTSLDKLGEVVTPEGLAGSFNVYARVVEELEGNRFPKTVFPGEPQLGRRNLYPNTSIKGAYSSDLRDLLDFLSYCDGTSSLPEIASRVGISGEASEAMMRMLQDQGIVVC